MKKVYLGINVSHGASASLMENGVIVAAVQEERFNKVKNFIGYPKKSIEFCLNYARKNKLNIDKMNSTQKHLKKKKLKNKNIILIYQPRKK